MRRTNQIFSNFDQEKTVKTVSRKKNHELFTDNAIAIPFELGVFARTYIGHRTPDVSTNIATIFSICALFFLQKFPRIQGGKSKLALALNIEIHEIQ